MTYILYTDSTPNPQKIAILLEELGQSYEVRHVDFSTNEQKTSEFQKLNPNGKVPVLIDPDADGFTLVESGAILLYLAEKHGQFLSPDPLEKSNHTMVDVADGRVRADVWPVYGVRCRL